MDAVRIRRVKRRYRLPASAEDTRRRLDRVFGMVLDGRLELALERAGVSPYEEICVRPSSSLYRPRLSLPDEQLATRWSLLLAESIQQAVSGRGADRVVRYTSRIQALADMAAGVLRGDFRRAWAWRQLGFWSGGERPSEGEAANELAGALMREPQAIVPVLTVLVRLGLAGPLCARIEAHHWTTLAAAASQAIAAPAGLAESQAIAALAGLADTRDKFWEQQRLELPPALAAYCRGLLRTSKLAMLSASVAEEALPAVALLVSIESDPVLIRRDRALQELVLAEIRRELRRRRTERFEKAATPVRIPAKDPELSPDTMPAPIRAQGRTNYGGLLFLLGVIDDLGLPLNLSESLQPRPLAWALHLLALTLTDASPDDPGALAFAGLAPDAEPPSRPEDPPSDEEIDAIHSSAAAILAEVEKRLDHLELRPEQLLRFVCRRMATIIADPGWIEAHFSMDDVSTDLRRVGLDLDPGFLPWLGVVVKFVYE